MITIKIRLIDIESIIIRIIIKIGEALVKKSGKISGWINWRIRKMEIN